MITELDTPTRDIDKDIIEEYKSGIEHARRHRCGGYYMTKQKIENGYKYNMGDKLLVLAFIVIGLFIVVYIVGSCLNPIELSWEEKAQQEWENRYGQGSRPWS